MREDSLFRDEQLEVRLIQGRLQFLALVVLACLAVLALRYHYLQIEQFEQFVTLSDENRIHVRAVPPTRGLIFDRNGVLLAENKPSYTLSVVPENVPNMLELVDKLSVIVDLTESDIERFQEQFHPGRRPFEAVPLRYSLTEEEVARFAVQEFDLPGADIQVELIRHYPLGEYFAHVVGYVGRINERDQASIDAEAYAGLHVIGKTGIERQYESELLGEVGYEYVETDARGNVLRVLERHHPLPGKNIYLNIDSELQVAVHDQLRGEQAAAVAIDTESSAVMALVSTPSFDPNLFVSGISTREYSALLQDLAKPLFNRAIQGQYPPGSTVKPMFGLIALEEEIVTPEFTVFDPGYYYLEGQERPYRDWKDGGHGTVNLSKAIEESCNVYYYELANKTGIDSLAGYGSRFGLGHLTGIDIPGEQSGTMPSPEWKREARGVVWYPGDTVNVGIGQGFTQVTPLQMAQTTAVIARRGSVIKPSLVQSVGEQSFEPVIEDVIEIKDENWDLVSDAMRNVIHGTYGTARAIGADLEEYEIAGKTGTAQAISIAEDVDYDDLELEKRLRDHALFIAYAPVEEPKFSVGVIVENGEHGGSMAAPIARIIFDKLLEPTHTDSPLEESRVAN
ncbi:MAG: penicillin-binding protein 2 [Porticoccaceae bacterium]|nr:penicillin-binding protein 2 [Porticoccaceae bacterium]